MKGAIGNAFILNIVITFIIIFYTLLITSMAYSKAYKVKNYLLNAIVDFDSRFKTRTTEETYSFMKRKIQTDFDSYVDDYLSRVGYVLSNETGTCPSYDDYEIVRDTKPGRYDFCIYWKKYDISGSRTMSDNLVEKKYTYKVVSYMKFDFPVVGSFIKLPLSGESNVIIRYGG